MHSVLGNVFTICLSATALLAPLQAQAFDRGDRDACPTDSVIDSYCFCNGDTAHSATMDYVSTVKRYIHESGRTTDVKISTDWTTQDDCVAALSSFAICQR